jgi:hypothetical protein
MRLGALPLWIREGKLTAVMNNPSDEDAKGELEALAGLPVIGLVAPQMALYEAVKKAYGPDSGGDGSMDEIKARVRRIAVTLRGVLAELEAIIGA